MNYLTTGDAPSPKGLHLVLSREVLPNSLSITMLEYCFDMLLGTPDHKENTIEFWFPPNTPTNYISRACRQVCGTTIEIKINTLKV
mgnify:CR=1 FL=1